MKVTKLLIKIPYYLLLVGVMSIGLLLLATLAPVPGNFKVKIVKSGSMEPTIMTGGIIVIRPTSDYKVGDIVTFGLDTKTQIPTTHRIVGEVGNGNDKVFTTKGDANDAEDSKTTKFSEVEGKVIFTLPYLGYVLDFARKPLGFLLLVGVPALIVICDELLNILREVVRLRNKKKIEAKIENDRRQRVVDLRVISKNKTIINEDRKSNSNFNLKALAILVVMLCPLVGLSSVGSTVSYYNEKEVSTDNTLKASLSYGLPKLDLSTGLDSSTASSTDISTGTDQEILDGTTTPATTTVDVDNTATDTPVLPPTE